MLLLLAAFLPSAALGFQPLPIPQCSGFHKGASKEVQQEAQDCILRQHAAIAYNLTQGDTGKAVFYCARNLDKAYGVAPRYGINMCSFALAEMGH